MGNATIKIKNDSIPLPSNLKKEWRGAEVYITGQEDTLSIKRLAKPAVSLGEMLSEFRKAARKTKLSKREVTEAIAEVRTSS